MELIEAPVYPGTGNQSQINRAKSTASLRRDLIPEKDQACGCRGGRDTVTSWTRSGENGACLWCSLSPALVIHHLGAGLHVAGEGDRTGAQGKQTIRAFFSLIPLEGSLLPTFPLLTHSHAHFFPPLKWDWKNRTWWGKVCVRFYRWQSRPVDNWKGSLGTWAVGEAIFVPSCVIDTWTDWSGWGVSPSPHPPSAQNPLKCSRDVYKWPELCHTCL